ncbi:MAG TPA: hypothetical protein VFE72_08815 [Lysobacter sp.]|nr:hypothetical protein [Lysobacter sp.]
MYPSNIIENGEGVQHADVRYFEVTGANFDANNNVVDIALPLDAEVIGGHINVTEAFNAATTDVLDVGDSASANRYGNDVNLKAVGRTALTPTGFVTTTSNKVLRLTRVPTGAKTAVGTLRVFVQTVTLGRSVYTQD